MPTLPASGYPTPAAPSIEALPTAPGGTQDIRATPEAFGMASALALSNFGTSLEKAAGYLGNIQDQYDKTVAQEARNRALAYSQKLLYGDPDIANDSGFFGTEGRIALDRRTDTLKNLEAVYTKERANLPTAQAQRLFDEGSSASRLHNQALVAHHASQQFQKYKTKEAESEIGLKLNEVSSASTRGDLDAMKQNLGEAINIATQALRERGASDAEIKSKASDLTATAVEYWSLGRAPTDPTGALAALEANKEHFTDPAKYARLYGQVKGHADKEAGRKLVESTTGPGPMGGASASGQEHYDRARAKGATHNEAVVLTANAEVESNFNPDATHDAETLAKRGLPPGFGMYGHNDKRLEKMRQKYGPHPNFDQQIEFALAELRSRPEGAAVNAATTPEQLLDVGNRFEQPKRTPEGDAKRLAATKKYMALSGSSTPPTQPAAGTEPSGPMDVEARYKAAIARGDTVRAEQILRGEAPTPTTTATPTTPAPAPAPTGGIPESPLAGQVARIQASGASPEVKEAAIAELNRQHQVRSLGQREADYELNKAINRQDPSITPDYIDSLVQTQRISPSDGTQALARLEKVKEDQRKIDAAIALVDSAKRGETVLDPTNTDHKKSVELHFANTARNWRPEEVWSKSLDYIREVNVVPAPIKALVTGNLYSGNEGRGTLGARQYRDIVALNPMLGEHFDADARAMAATLNTMAGFGMVPKEAFTQAQAQMRVPQAEQEARRKSFDSVRGTTEQERLAKDTQAITSRHNSWFAWPRGIDDPGKIPDAMLFDFREAAQTFYARTGNIDAAYQAAYDTTALKWAPTRVGADGLRWTKGSPEALYGAPGRTDNTDWMNTQLLADVNAAAPKPFTLDQLHIVPTPPESTKPGDKPGYYVWYLNEAGHFDYVRDANRVPLTWRPNWTTSSVRASEAEELRRRHEERAKAPVATAPVPPVPQPPLPEDATFGERLRRVPSRIPELRWPGPSGTRPQ